MTQEELESKYLNKWVKINEYEIEREEFVYSSGRIEKTIKWEDEPIEGVVKYIDLYDDETNNYYYLEISLLIPFQETVTIITYFEHITVDTFKTLKMILSSKKK